MLPQNGIPTLDVIVPLYNESQGLHRNLNELRDHLRSLPLVSDWRLLLVDDGSVDATPALAEEFAATEPRSVVVHHPVNRGLGAALRTGFSQARSDLVATVDADLSYAPRHLDALVAALNAGADLAIASPYAPGGKVSGVPLGRRVMSRCANLALRFATRRRLHTFTGMVRAYRRAVLAHLDLTSDGVDINLEILEQAFLKGWSIVESTAELAWRKQSPERARRFAWSTVPTQIATVARYGVRLRTAQK